MATKKAKAPEKVQEMVGKLVGTAIIRPLSEVKPNTWNPNVMTDFQKKSIRHGFIHDGWIASQALLIWGTDERGKRKNIIIDGEHRYFAAIDCGMKEGPMVFLERLSEPQAKALTVKMDAKRGKFADAPLSEILREVQFELGDDVNLSLALGMEEDIIMGLLAEPEQAMEIDAGSSNVIGNLPSTSLSQVKMVQLMFDAATHEEFHKCTKDLAIALQLTNTTDVIVEVVKRAHAQLKEGTLKTAQAATTKREGRRGVHTAS